MMDEVKLMDDAALIWLLRDLADSRTKAEEAKAAKDKALAEFKASEPYQSLTVASEEWSNRVFEVEAKLHEQTLAAHAQRGVKALLGGALKIRLTLAYEFSLKDLTTWARTEAPILLNADVKAFEKMVRSMDRPPAFVTQKEIPQATIAVDLSKYLKGGEGG